MVLILHYKIIDKVEVTTYSNLWDLIFLFQLVGWTRLSTINVKGKHQVEYWNVQLIYSVFKVWNQFKVRYSVIIKRLKPYIHYASMTWIYFWSCLSRKLHREFWFVTQNPWSKDSWHLSMGLASTVGGLFLVIKLYINSKLLKEFEVY